jgi:cytoskeletal protein RodZ
VFIKGFIRSYGQAIGSNVDELMAAYHESGSKPQDTGTSNIASSPAKDEPLKCQSGFPRQAVIGFGAALLIITGGVYWITSEKGENAGQSQQVRPATPSMIDNNLPEVEDEAESTASEEASASLPAAAEGQNSASNLADAAAGSSEPPVRAAPDNVSAEAKEAHEPIKNTFTVPEKLDTIKDFKDQIVPELPEPMEPATEVAMGDASLRLVIRVSEDSWFNLRIDDQRDQDFILPPGGSKTIQADNTIVMTIGNRRATQMTLNGQQLDLPESPDNVIRNLTVNAEQLN